MISKKTYKLLRYTFRKVLLMCFAMIIGGQSSMAIDGPEPKLFFRHIGPEHGLSHAKVNSIVQDKRGFIWLGTEDGLNRYDGRSFTIYRHRPDDSTSLSGNIITDLHEDEQGILWIATADGGLTGYDHRSPAAGKFRQYRHDPKQPGSLPDNRIDKMVDDGHGYLWLVTGSNLLVRFNKELPEFNSVDPSNERKILTIELLNNGQLLVSREGTSPLIINTLTLKSVSEQNYKSNDQGSVYRSVNTAFTDSKKRIWFASRENGLQVYQSAAIPGRSSENKYNKVLRLNSEVVSISEDKNNRLWLAGKETGVAVLEPESGKFTAYRHSENNGALASDHVNTLITDRSGIIWIGTNNGLSIYDPVYSPFQKFYLPANANGKTVEINDFYRDEHEDLWIATNNGIYIREHKTGQFKFRRTSYRGVPLAVTKFFNGKDGVFYIGTDQSIFKYDRQKNRLSRLSDSASDPIMKKLPGSRITSIVSDSIDHHPALIVSSYGRGLAYYDLSMRKWVLRPDHIKGNINGSDGNDNEVKKLYRDRAGSIWIATADRGLGLWQQTGQPIKYVDERSDIRSSTASKAIYDIKEDNAGNLWISTYGGGLHHFDTKHFLFDHIDGSSNLTEGLQTDRHGNVWMVSNGHLHAYSPLNKVYSCYDLPDVKNDGGIKGYIYRDRNGVLYAAGINYYVTFDPASVSKIASQPDLFFTDFKIFNKSNGHLLDHSEIKLNHTQNYFSIEFAAPEYNSNHVQFAYMLDGFDNEWIVADRQNFASYSNLPPGRYVFKVKASNWEGNKTDKIKTLTITIEPPFYRRWYFFVAAGILITGLLYLVYRYRINEYLKRQAIRNMIAQDLHDQIGSTLSSIAVYSKVAKVYQMQREPEKLTEVLTTIGCTASETIVEMADIVWAINPKNDQVSSIIQKIQSYARPLCAAQNIEFIFSCDAKILKLTLEMSARKNFYLILKEAITNAIKHSDCSQLKVDIRLHHYVIEMLIEDNGAGFDTTSDTRSTFGGNGLTNITSRARELGAELYWDSRPGQGTRLSVVFNT